MSIIKAIKNSEKIAIDRNWSETYWFFDIHSTVLEPNYTPDDIPKKFYPYAKEVLQHLSQRSDVVIGLYTCSHPHEIEQYLEFFKSHDIDFVMVNENPFVKTKLKGYGNYDKKPYMNVLFEDKAGFDPLTDWAIVYQYLLGYNPKKIETITITNHKNSDAWNELAYNLKFEKFEQENIHLVEDDLNDKFYTEVVTKFFEYGEYANIELEVDEDFNIIKGKFLEHKFIK